nr:hypothetical protein CFP56_10401 [Quercus suber]
MLYISLQSTTDDAEWKGRAEARHDKCEAGTVTTARVAKRLEQTRRTFPIGEEVKIVRSYSRDITARRGDGRFQTRHGSDDGNSHCVPHSRRLFRKTGNYLTSVQPLKLGDQWRHRPSFHLPEGEILDSMKFVVGVECCGGSNRQLGWRGSTAGTCPHVDLITTSPATDDAETRHSGGSDSQWYFAKRPQQSRTQVPDTDHLSILNADATVCVS